MLRKVFILTQFGKPHEWTQEYIDHVQKLGKNGWYWKIFTPNKLESKGNVEIIPMTIEQFNDLIELKCGVNPKNFITEEGVPSKPVSDFYVASGKIFEDYIKSYDFWGMTNWDVVYGNLSTFLPDDFLNDSDIFTDDVMQVNGVFSLFRNHQLINRLYETIPDWQTMFTEHRLFGIDEYHLIKPILKANEGQLLRYRCPAYYPMHSYDRLIQHQPTPQLELQEDGSLYEKFRDIRPPVGYLNFKGYIAKEIMYFHFSFTKKWPL